MLGMAFLMHKAVYLGQNSRDTKERRNKMRKSMGVLCVILSSSMVFVKPISASPMVNEYIQWDAARKADPNSRYNQRKRDFNKYVSQIADNMDMGGGMQMNPQVALGQQIGAELRGHLLWFVNFGEDALVNNRAEYAARLLRIQQLRNVCANIPGGNEVVAMLRQIINELTERFEESSRPRSSRGSAPKFA